MGVRLPQDYSNTETPVVLENFDGFRDLAESKADAQTIVLRPALTNDKVTLLTHAYVEKLVTDQRGKKLPR